MAKGQFPGKRNSLDALCQRFGIDNSQRTLHGALLDAELLADVYLSMTRGQNSLVMEPESARESAHIHSASRMSVSGVELGVVLATEEECTAHESILADITKSAGRAAVWSAT
jgi:DNA polymerase III subunit epsilon